jgi:hypothetical protein
MNKELITELDSTGTSFTQVVASFEPETFNTVPFPGSWTPAQVADHILKSLSGIPEMMYGKTKSTQRPPNENVEAIKNLFLNFDIKMQSPEFVLPGNKIYDKDRLLNALQNMFTQIKDAVQTSDLSATCLGFEFPGFGYLTGLEWAHFAVYHTQRHIHQLKNIRQKLVNGS